MGTRERRGIPAGLSPRLRDVGPSKPGVEVLRVDWLGRTGRSKPGSSLRGELAADGTLEPIRRGGSRGSSSSMRPKRSLIELARERVVLRLGAPPFTGDAVLALLMPPTMACLKRSQSLSFV